MGSLFLIPAPWETVWHSSLLCFLSSLLDKCTGNRQDQRGASGATMAHADNNSLGCWGLEGNSLGLSVLLAHDRNNQSFLVLGQLQVGPKRITELPIMTIWWTTAATYQSMVLACNNGRSRIPTICPRICRWVHACIRPTLFGQFLCQKISWEEFLFGQGCSRVCKFLLCLVCLNRLLCALACEAQRQQWANCDNFQFVFYLQRLTSSFGKNATWFWAPNLWNRGRWWSWGLPTS